MTRHKGNITAKKMPHQRVSGRVITRWISAHRIFSASNIKKINRIGVRTHTYYLNKTDARSGCNYSG